MLLSIALDEAMFGGSRHTKEQLAQAVSDLVWLGTERYGYVDKDQIADVLDYLEEECRGAGGDYEGVISRLRRKAAPLLPDAGQMRFKEVPRAYHRENWPFPAPESLRSILGEGGYEPQPELVSHLTLHECFLYLYECCAGAVSLLRKQEEISEAFVRERLLPFIHPDLADVSGEEEKEAGAAPECFFRILCSLLSDGFGLLAALYLDRASGDDAGETLDALCVRAVRIEAELSLPCRGLLAMAMLAPLAGDTEAGRMVMSRLERPAGQVLDAYERAASDVRNLQEMHGFDTQSMSEGALSRVMTAREAMSGLYAEYCCFFAEEGYLAAKEARKDIVSRIPEEEGDDEEAWEAGGAAWTEGMNEAAGFGISRAAEELARAYYYGMGGVRLQHGYAKYYAGLVTMRHIRGTFCSAIDSEEGIRMAIPGMDE